MSSPIPEDCIGVHLHQYKYLWSACTKRETVIKAWKKLRKGKTRRQEVIRIEANFDHYVDLMIETLSNTRPGGDPSKAFHPQILKPKHINEHGKDRTIYCPPIWEQWVHHVIIIILAPIVQKYAYRYSCGSMPKRGGLFGRKRLGKIIKRRGFKYFAKLDIRHFFNSVRLEVVIRELKMFINDDWFIYLIRVVFTQFNKGLPLGFYISQWLANFVLCRVDWTICRFKVICYIRYMDDFVICSNNKKQLHRLIREVSKTLGKLRLRLGSFQVIRFIFKRFGVIAIGHPIDFMGYMFRRDKITLRSRIYFRSTRMAKKLKNLRVIALKQAQAMLSRIGWYKYTDTKWTYIFKIRPCISIRSLKQIVRTNTRRSLAYENQLAERDDLRAAA